MVGAHMVDRPVHGLRCNRPCSRLVVGSEPGWKEIAQGEPFVGPTGDELNRLLDRIGFPRPMWALTNYFRRPAPGKGIPHPNEDYEEAGHHLKLELTRVQPKLIVPLGREAIRYFLGDVDVDEVWGLHLTPPADVRARLPMLRPDVTIAPQVHPAQGFHSPDASNQVLVGFERLRRVLQGLTPARGLYDDPYPEPDYREMHTPAEFEQWADDINAILQVANDTEGYPHAPWSIQLSKAPGDGVLLRDPAVIAAYIEWAREAKPTMTFHSGLHDATMNRVFGLDIFEDGIPYEDTMLMAYELGVIPQGLKPLAVRECAMAMLGYKEVLGDAQERHALTYLNWVWETAHERWMRMRQEDFDFQVRVAKRRIKALPKLPKSDLMKSVERCIGAKDPYKLWNDQVDDRHVEAYGLARCEMPQASLSDVDPALALRYASRDPDATGRLAAQLLPRVREMGLEPVYRLDLGTYPILDRMMRVGMQPDHAAFTRLAATLDAELATLKASLAAVTGWPEFNPNSGDQTAAYIFDTLGLDMLGKRTDSGRGSTNDKVLEALEKMYPELPQIADIRSYREYFKLRWTFVERLPELVNRWPFDGRIHCELMLNRTPSGRLASKNPNLLAMPKHGKFAKAFRACFVPREGCLFLSADESQVELRGLAHLSQDPIMCAIFRGEKRNPDGSRIDLHAAMAQRIFGVAPKDQDESKHRLPSKAVNFGLPMGMTAVGLCLELRKGGLSVDEDDAQRWIDEADAMYVKVPEYKAAMIAEAEKNGFVRCFSGRIRHVGGIRSRDDRVRAEAERFAFSTPIQEIAQTIGKHCLTRAWNEVYVPRRKQGEYVEPLLWTHDDLLSEVSSDVVLDVAKELHTILTTAPKGFSIPLETKPEAGLNWAEMVKL
jgi:uracil-DNA glycosylase family 4